MSVADFEKILEGYREAHTNLTEMKKRIKEDPYYFDINWQDRELAGGSLGRGYEVISSCLNDVHFAMKQITRYLNPPLPSPVYKPWYFNYIETKTCNSCMFFVTNTNGETICKCEKMAFSALPGTATSNLLFKFDSKEHKWQKRAYNQTICKNYFKKEVNENDTYVHVNIF